MNRQGAFDKAQTLSNDFLKLTFNVSIDGNLNNCINDCTQSQRFGERLWALCRLIVTESFFAQLSQEVEEDKSLFTVQKKSKGFFDEVLLPFIDDVVTISKQWKFHDYRAVNLQSEARDLAKEIREMYIEIYR